MRCLHFTRRLSNIDLFEFDILCDLLIENDRIFLKIFDYYTFFLTLIIENYNMQDYLIFIDGVIN